MKKLFRYIRKRIILGLLAKGIHVPILFLDKYRELVYIRQLITQEGINCILDVGANIGQFAEDMRFLGFHDEIISFEPIKSEFDKMAKKFKHDSNWSGHQIALGSISETRNFNVSDETMLSSLLDTASYINFDRHETVEVKRLDEIFNELEIPAEAKILLKTDTQGFDIEVFKGASGCLNRISAITAEISAEPLYLGVPNYKDALKIFENAGFRLANITIVMRNIKNEVVDMNCLLKR